LLCQYTLQPRVSQKNLIPKYARIKIPNTTLAEKFKDIKLEMKQHLNQINSWVNCA